jgi:hypothetical protein
MLIRLKRFNPYLVTGMMLLAMLGCQSERQKRKHQLTTVRIHVQVNTYATNRTEVISVFRQKPMTLIIEKEPFLGEGDLSEAKVVQAVGGFSIQLRFARQGALLLEQYSAVNRGKHFAIFSQFPDQPGGPINAGRWLAAPMITQHIADGVITFTPDASREETEQIVLGLNNVAHELHNEPK